MKRDPMKGYRAPTYPRRDAVDGRTLGENLPARWKRPGALATGVAMLVGAPVAQGDVTPPPKPGPNAGVDPGNGPPVRGTPTESEVRGARMSALFEHGEGRGAFGCVAVAPPAFLTEADARQVILEEFAKAGVAFELDKMKLPSLRERQVSNTYKEVDPKKSKKGERFEVVTTEKDLGPVTLDGWDPKRRIGFEYISEGDYFKLGGAQSSSTVQDYDFRAIARRMAGDAQHDPSVHVGVFYDPMARAEWKEDKHGNYRAEDHGKGKTELRAQVRDFIEFLRREKVL